MIIKGVFFFVCLFWKALNGCCCKIRTHNNTTLKAFSQQDCGSQQRRKRSVDQAGGRGKRSAVVSAGPVVVNAREALSSCESCKWLIVYTELACSRCRSLWLFSHQFTAHLKPWLMWSFICRDRIPDNDLHCGWINRPVGINHSLSERHQSHHELLWTPPVKRKSSVISCGYIFIIKIFVQNWNKNDLSIFDYFNLSC